jgi:hypothetical protein
VEARARRPRRCRGLAFRRGAIAAGCADRDRVVDLAQDVVRVGLARRHWEPRHRLLRRQRCRGVLLDNLH